MQFRRSRPEWRADLWFLGAAWLLSYVFFLLTWSDPDPAHPPSFPREMTVAAISAVPMLLFRRTRPVALALVMIISELATDGAMGLAALAVYNVAVRRARSTAIVVAMTHVLTISLLYRMADVSAQEYWLGVVVIFLVHTTAVAIGLLVRSRQQLVLAARERARQAEEGQRLRVEEARHHERERLAREMHDVLAHRISLLAVHAGALEYGGNLAPEEAQAVGIIRQCAHDALEDLRDAITMLREDSHGENGDRPQPTLSDLPALVEQSRRAGAQVALNDRSGDTPEVPARLGRHAYRIVQEGLTNAHKHAPGAPVRVTVEAPPGGGLMVEVTNRLPSRSVPAELPGAGAGLIGLRERVDLVGGQLEHGRTPHGEFRLSARLPLPE